MIELETLADLELLRESIDLECKLALGRDGQGALPEDFWPTYSAFANTDGGVVILGVRERKGRFLIEGIAKVDKIRKELFDALNNRQKVSANVLTDSSVREVSCLPGAAIPEPEEVLGAGSEQLGARTPNFGLSSPNLGSSSQNSARAANWSGERDEDGCLVDDRLDLPVIDDVERQISQVRDALDAMPYAPRTKGKVEDAALTSFRALDYGVWHGPQLAPGEQTAERISFADAILIGRPCEAIRRLNPVLPDEPRATCRHFPRGRSGRGAA